jgi:hypothetical protein
MQAIDLEGYDLERLGIEVSIQGVYAQRRGIEGAEHMVREYSYIDTLEPFRLLVNGQELSLPDGLRAAIEENITSSLFEQ